MNELSEILEGCRRNERKWQEKLYRQFYPAMFSLCKKFFSDPHQIQTSLNNGMLRVFKNIKQYDSSRGEFFNWMYTIVRHSCLTDLRRKVQIQNEISSENVGEMAEKQEEHPFDFESLTEKIELLPQATRVIIMLFYVEDFSIREIHEQLNISEGTVKWHLNQGRNRLKQIIAQS